MASKIAANRLRKDLKAISKSPPPYINVACDDSNILHWLYVLEGPEDTPYQGGWYFGRLKFPHNFPMAPPSILMVTPNGRFETNTRLCLSMSDYHPESWNPSWNVGTVLTGLLSFMCEETATAGAMVPPRSVEERKDLAAKSVAWNKGNDEFCKAFPDFEEIMAQSAANKKATAAPATVPGVAEAAGGGDDATKASISDAAAETGDATAHLPSPAEENAPAPGDAKCAAAPPEAKEDDPAPDRTPVPLGAPASDGSAKAGYAAAA
eukprot:TRINITY_DN122635_c0_g1_i1.p1 TRINITY_DN122635_c0_g1~~TRINITY_DN122635_c0_g1_i1.p1  ORF type:complete len:265 (+),score=54.92 TRINITY_DN122635_c0_g1_i1:87-881(+)